MDQKRIEAIKGLAAMGDESGAEHAASVAARLHDASPKVRVAAVRALVEMGKWGRTHADAVAIKLDDDEVEVQVSVLRALAAMGRGGEAHVLSVIKKLQCEDATVRREAVKTASTMSETSRHGEALAELLTHNEALVREAAQKTLGGLKHTEPAILSKMAKGLGDVDIAVREATVWALASRQAAGKRFADDIAVLLLEDSDAGVRIAAMSALARFGEAGARHVEAVVAQLTDENRWVRKAALQALAGIGNTAHMKHVVARLDDDSVSVRIAALNVLGTLGAAATAFEFAVRARLLDSDQSVQEAARILLLSCSKSMQ